MPEETDDGIVTGEFDCPPGRITVDLITDPTAAQGPGIHIYFFDPEVSQADMLQDSMLPTMRQLEHVAVPLMKWLVQHLE